MYVTLSAYISKNESEKTPKKSTGIYTREM